MIQSESFVCFSQEQELNDIEMILVDLQEKLESELIDSEEEAGGSSSTGANRVRATHVCHLCVLLKSQSEILSPLLPSLRLEEAARGTWPVMFRAGGLLKTVCRLPAS